MPPARRSGAKFRGHVKRNGKGPVYWTECVVTDCVPGSLFGFDVLTGGKALNHWAYAIEPAGEGSDVTESFRLAPTFALQGSTGPCWAGPGAGPTGRGMQATLEAIKAEVERTPA